MVQLKGDAQDIMNETKKSSRPRNGIKLSFKPYDLQLRHAFTLAESSRTVTPSMLVELEFDGLVGYGEAAMPPYLGESYETATRFLNSADLGQFNDPFRLDEILGYVDSVAVGNCAAKASIDIALHDLVGKMMQQPWHRIWGFSAEDAPISSMTIGIDTDELLRQKVREAEGFKILKIKLGRSSDKEMIGTIRSMTDVPLSVDANQGWKNRIQALESIFWLKEQGVVFIEQPMPKSQIDDIAWLTLNSPLPIIADEGVQRLTDLESLRGVYSGINIKLMKCTGMREAHKMLTLARALDMKVMIGCMTETSCAVSAAAQLSPKVDWADLDGNLLISNDAFTGVKIVDGKIQLNGEPGIGVKRIE